MAFAIFLSIIYVGGIGYGMFRLHLIPQTINDWALSLAGFSAPLALAWLIGVLIFVGRAVGAQRRELELARDAFEAQKTVLGQMHGQIEALADRESRTAQDILEAGRLGRATTFVNSLPLYEARLGKVVEEIGKRLPVLQQAGDDKPVGRPPRDFGTLATYLDVVAANKVDLKEHLGGRAADVMKLVREYQNSFNLILAKAQETNNTILLLGPMAETNNQLTRHFGSAETDS